MPQWTRWTLATVFGLSLVGNMVLLGLPPSGDYPYRRLGGYAREAHTALLAAMVISSGLLWSNLKRDERSSFEATVCGVCFAVSLMGLALLAPVFLITT